MFERNIGKKSRRRRFKIYGKGNGPEKDKSLELHVYLS